MKRLGGEDSGCEAFAAGLAETQGEAAGPGWTETAAEMHTHANIQTQNCEYQIYIA